MERISSRSTVISKRVFPVVWFGFLAIFVVIIILGGISGQERWPVLIVHVLMAALGYLLMKALVLDLVDEVWDAGDYLLVRNKGEEIRVRLGEIVNVSYSAFSNPRRTTLLLRTAGRLGREITFIPVSSAWPFSRNQ